MEHEFFFTSSLLSWNRNVNTREMPWKGEKDPYRIWISEIILQQTRVQQGSIYYQRFIKKFPNIESLASAPEQKVYKLWEGLGYYSRCRNLLATAKFIHENYDDKFPDQFESILSLKGIGPYTASAIASFAFDLPYAVLDGNVFRVLSRFFGIEIPINTTEGKKYYISLAQLLLDKQNPAEYNQAIMDFGAVVCKPAHTLCDNCTLKRYCAAFINNKVSVLPVNEKVIRQKERFFTYLVVQYGEKFYVNERTQKDIWQNLFEFILIETKLLMNKNEFLAEEEFLTIFGEDEFKVEFVSEKYSQKLTHQVIYGRFIGITLKRPLKSSKQYRLVSKKQLKMLPFPKFITSYLTDKNVSLNLIL